ncbi:Glutamate--cysteine ligase [Elsinoe australis]|uniref:Glutamate--cysteine ligase n=1 Tax=Elsinoe australis TaxID=40998 RepID=A0A2P7Z2N7_9PEZI|nr:Glutamate--cysteine ligase [Elsinoe australis]
MPPKFKKPTANGASGKPRVLYWFRTDLRLHDSPALHAALDLKPEVLYPVWTWDPHYVYHARVGPNRFQFLIDCQNDVSASLTKINSKQKLLVIREGPQTVIKKLIKEWKITHLVFEKDTDAYARERDEDVMKQAKEAGAEVIVKMGRTLWDPDEVVKKNGGKPTMSINQLEAAGNKVGDIAKPVPTPKNLPDPGPTDLSFAQDKPDSQPDFNKPSREKDNSSYAHGLSGPKKDFAPPTLEELGMPAATTPHKGGETRALEILEDVISNKEYTATFEKPKTSPAQFSPQATCLTSPYLHFGALSVREFYWRVQSVLDTIKNHSVPPVSLHGQLLFRDMYFAAQAALGHAFAQTYNNPTVRFVPWHLPSTISPTTGLITGAHEVDSATAASHLHRWTHGLTGFPWIDALMRQLRQEGWIHHLGRHSVACFLTRGGCYISWERGAEVFEELLIDHETACNSGNWQWLSCTAFFAQFYRCYSPVAFGQKWDKEGHFVRRYVPELEDVPAKYIYEPWKMPIQDQRKAGVVIKGDGEGAKEEDGCKVYPKPMLDFGEMRKRCIDGLKEAYDRKLYGNSKEVKDGSWRKLFDDQGEGPTEGDKGQMGGMVGAEEEDGNAEEGTPATPKRKKEVKTEVKTESPKSTRTTRGQKREAGQGTLDGSVKRTRK